MNGFNYDLNLICFEEFTVVKNFKPILIKGNFNNLFIYF